MDYRETNRRLIPAFRVRPAAARDAPRAAAAAPRRPRATDGDARIRRR
jgi:hypothetical protein